MTTIEEKFKNPLKTTNGTDRAWVPFNGLKILWFNTGSLCNLTCDHCYMESSPQNDSLVYINTQETLEYVDEALKNNLDLNQVGFTGGEPFLNPEIIDMVSGCLERGLSILVLTNAMKPLQKHKQSLLYLNQKFSDQIILRVSLDHYSKQKHDEERGQGSFKSTLNGMKWLSENGFNLAVAGRSLWNESKKQVEPLYRKLFEENNVQLKNDNDLVIFPEMNLQDQSPPEITVDCWDILNIKPETMMCANSRMVVKRKGAEKPSVVSCTLLPYDEYFDSGDDINNSYRKTYLKHVYCAQFCVLGGASCES